MTTDGRSRDRDRGRFLVMRYGTLVGYANQHRIVTVASRHVALDTALGIAGAAQRSADGQSAYWIAEVGRPARRWVS